MFICMGEALVLQDGKVNALNRKSKAVFPGLNDLQFIQSTGDQPFAASLTQRKPQLEVELSGVLPVRAPRR